MSLTRANSFQHCPVCSSPKGCSWDLNSGNFLCIHTHESVHGFRYIKDAGGFGILRESSEVNQPRKFGNYKTLKSAGDADNLPKLSTKDLIETLDNLRLSMHLESYHLDELVAKGLTVEQIKHAGFRSIENDTLYRDGHKLVGGFDEDLSWRGATGILCPARGIDGEILGFQVKTKQEGKKYVWCSYFKNGVRVNSPHINVKGKMELPLSVNVVKKQTNEDLYLSEGILKPLIASYRLGINVIGAASGFQSCFNQLKSYIEQLKPSRVIFLADSGSLLNPSVILTLSSNNEAVKQITGKSMLVADYGQLNGNGDDCDEITPDTFNLASFINYDSLVTNVKAGSSSKAVNRVVRNVLESTDTIGFDNYLLKNALQYDYGNKTKLHAPSANTAFKGVYYDTSDHKQIISDAYSLGYKYILDVSPAGSSKSYRAGLFNTSLIKGKKVPNKTWYFSKQHRSPSTRTLEYNFTQHPTKNTRMFSHPFKKTPNGLPVLMREGEKGSLPVKGNCVRADQQIILYQQKSNISLCKTCPFRDKCKTSESPGEYGYLFQVDQALQSNKISANIQGVNFKESVSENDIAFVDEYTQTIDFVEQIVVRQHDFTGLGNLSALLGANYTLIQRVLDLINSSDDLPLYGLSKEDFIKRYGTNPALSAFAFDAGKLQADHNDIEVKSGGQATLEFWSTLLNALSGLHDDLSFTITKGTLTLFSYNHSVLEKLNSFSTIVFMDATSNREELARFLGVDPATILVISQRGTSLRHLEVKQCVSLGTLGCNRTDATLEKVRIVRERLNERYGDDIGFIDYKRFANQGDLYKFVDGRGSNAFEAKKALCIFGTSNTNVGAARAIFECLTCKVSGEFDYAFREFYESKRQAEMVQELGRLRAARRRGESLTCYFFGNLSLRFLEAHGVRLSVIRGFEIDERINTHKDTIIQAISSFKDLGMFRNMSIRKFAEFANVSRGYLTSLVQREYKAKGGWSALRDAVLDEIVREPKLILIALAQSLEDKTANTFEFKEAAKIYKYYYDTICNKLNNVSIDRDDYYSDSRILDISDQCTPTELAF
jgi:hypothetical protein